MAKLVILPTDVLDPHPNWLAAKFLTRKEPARRVWVDGSERCGYDLAYVDMRVPKTNGWIGGPWVLSHRGVEECFWFPVFASNELAASPSSS